MKKIWPLAKVPEVAHTLFLPQGVKIELIFALRATVSKIWFLRYGPTSKIAIFGHETWPLAKVPEVAHILTLYTRAAKMSLFSLYGQRFPRLLKLPIFGHEIWPLGKVPGVAHIQSFYPRGSKLSLFTLYGQRLPEYGLIAADGYRTPAPRR